MKHFFSTLFVVFFAATMMAQTGLTCEDPIPVNSDYVGRVDGPCTLWYTAGSYDLPLKVHFIPDADNSTWGPEVEVDFTCTPGVYDDPKLDSLLTMVGDFDVSFPLEFVCNLVTPNGKNEWDLSINENYRETLAEYGITYNLQAFVKVVFEEAGIVSLRPDSAFQACMENTPKINLGDTIEILPNDSNSAYIFSYTDWQEDSIRFVWVGDEPARLHLATIDCEFVPAENNGFIWNRIDLVDGTPHKLYSEQMKADIKKNKAGGLYYGKIISPVVGKFVVEKIPMNAAQGGAILLEYGKSIQLAANDTNTLYCFPRTWTSTAFTSSSDFNIQMYSSPSYDFGIASANGAWRRIFVFDKDVDGRLLNISTKEMQVVTSRAIDDYIYVRFVCNAPTTITPNSWETTECANQSTLIRPNAAFAVVARSSNVIYRMRYQDWVGYDITIQWGGNVKLPTYIADACSYTLSANSTHVLKYAEVQPQSSVFIDAATIDTWASRVDEDGYLYVRFNPTNQGSVTFKSTKPEDVDPERPDPIHTSFDAIVCFGETYEWNGQTYDETDKYTQTFPAANGADSIVTLNLTVLPEVPVTEEIAAVCYGETYTWQGQEYAASGEYSVILQDVNGCDSVITLALTVYPQTQDTTEEVTIKFGESYDWNGETYSAAGEYTITLQDANGCNYQATLILTVLPEEKPEEDGTILLNPTDELVLNLDSAVNVYRTDYDVWSAAKVQLGWYGDKPLHVFVSKDKDFFVAIYHEDVVLYQKIDAADPTSGEPQVLVLDMSALRAYVNDGKLYVRFLTDSDARLVIEPLME